MKLKTGFEIFILDTLPRWLMSLAGMLLLFVIGIQVGIYEGRELQREAMSNEQRAMSNELKVAKEKSEEMEKEMEHQKLVRAIAMCESSGRHDGVWGDGGKSYGLFQFQKKTFYWLVRKMQQPPESPFIKGELQLTANS